MACERQRYQSNHRRRTRCVVVLLVWTVFSAANIANALEAGAAKTEITPPLGTPLNGYGDRLGRGAVAVHDQVWARCLYLDDGETNLFLVNTDLCFITRELRDRVLELAPKEVPPERIILTATHTHNGHGGMVRGLLLRSASGRFMPEVLESTAARIAETMRQAHSLRKRGAIGYGTGTQDGLSKNRRVDEGSTDPQIGVIRVEDADGAPIAILANFAAHPTSVGERDRLSVSADYPGYYYSELEKLAGSECVAMFTNGAQGNQTCGNPEERTGWPRTESIGRLLAGRVFDVADKLVCGDAKLTVGYAAPQLPRTIANNWFPPTTVLHTIEINDLLLTFFPGEPCVELGLRMRDRALERGYTAQFTVGLADDYLLYFAPTEYYAKPCYETAASFYGPFVENWFYREFSKLMTKGEPELDLPVRETPEVNARAGADWIRVEGGPYERGHQQGAAFAGRIVRKFEETVVAPCDSGALIPKAEWWTNAPSFINIATVAVPRLAIAARPMLEGLDERLLHEMDGMAAGAGLSFDACWLVHCASVLAAQTDVEALYGSPFCTMFAAVGDRAGADEVLVGRNFDWAGSDRPVVIDTVNERGQRFVRVGFGWTTGAFTGMNDSGLIVCAERVEALGRPSTEGPPIELVLREILEGANGLKAATAQLQAASHLRGYHVLVADSTSARVVEFGDESVVRKSTGGLLLGADSEGLEADDPRHARYTRAAKLLEEERILSVAEIQGMLVDAAPECQGQERIFNGTTRASVVFEPKARKMHVAFRQDDGSLGDYLTIDVKAQAKPAGSGS